MLFDSYKNYEMNKKEKQPNNKKSNNAVKFGYVARQLYGKTNK